MASQRLFLKLGMPVISSAGERYALQSIALRLPDFNLASIIARKGWLTPKDYLVPAAQIKTERSDDSFRLPLSTDDPQKQPYKAASAASSKVALARSMTVRFQGSIEGGLAGVLLGLPEMAFLGLVVNLRRRLMIIPPHHIESIVAETVNIRIPPEEALALKEYRPDADILLDLTQAILDYQPLASIDAQAIHVKVEDGVARLWGNVRAPVARTETEDIARGTRGVMEVQNHLVSDWDLECGIADELAKNGSTRAQKVIVRSSLGKVVLEGSVPTEAIRQAAEEVAKAFPGVASVQSRLLVPVTAQASPSGQAA